MAPVWSEPGPSPRVRALPGTGPGACPYLEAPWGCPKHLRRYFRALLSSPCILGKRPLEFGKGHEGEGVCWEGQGGSGVTRGGSGGREGGEVVAPLTWRAPGLTPGPPGRPAARSLRASPHALLRKPRRTLRGASEGLRRPHEPTRASSALPPLPPPPSPPNRAPV